MLTEKEIDSAFNKFVKRQTPYNYYRIEIYDGFMIIGSVSDGFSFENDIGKTENSQIVVVKAENIEHPMVGFYAAFDAFRIFDINHISRSLERIKDARIKMIDELKSKIDEYNARHKLYEFSDATAIDKDFIEELKRC